DATEDLRSRDVCVCSIVWSRPRRQIAPPDRRIRWSSGREPLDLPGVGGASVAEAVVEAVGAALPELDDLVGQAVAAPETGQGELAVLPGGHLGHAPLQDGPAVDHPALGGGGRAELAARRARVEVGLALGPGGGGDPALDADLAFQLAPPEHQGGQRVGGQLGPLAALVVGVEAEAELVAPAQQT